MAGPMGSAFFWLRARLLPALLTALGVSIVTGGLLTYTDPVEAVAPSSQAPAGLESPAPTPRPTFPPVPTPIPGVGSPRPVSGNAGSSAAPGGAGARVATRVVVRALGIDLPVVRPPDDRDHYPYCNVAEYITSLHQPGELGTTYLYAHARAGMFLPILEASKIRNGRSMVGMLVEVYTNDDQVFLYEVVRVLRHQTTLDRAYAATTEQLMLQTSEGPPGTPGKTILVAKPLSRGPAAPEAARPRARPVRCG